MTRFFVKPQQIKDGIVTLDSDDAIHLSRVLRANPGDKVDILDGSGKIYHSVITHASKSNALAKIESDEILSTEPTIKITVAQALPKTSEKLEWVLQHGVEIGATGFWMFRSRRSEAGKLAEREDRWAKIIKTAAEQSGRAVLPTAESLGTFVALLPRVSEFDLVLFCDEDKAARPLSAVLSQNNPKTVLVLIGPEGGWTPDEREMAVESGMHSVSLGPRTLRTETAALAALSQILYALDAG